MHWYLEPWKKYLDFSGRARRREFWPFTLVNLAICLALVAPWRVSAESSTYGSELIDPSQFWLATAALVFLLVVLLPLLAATVRRLHDTGKSGAWFLISFVPFGGLVLLAFMLQGSQPLNQYGPSPKEVSRTHLSNPVA